jgi:hypothetical protein
MSSATVMLAQIAKLDAQANIQAKTVSQPKGTLTNL